MAHSAEESVSIFFPKHKAAEAPHNHFKAAKCAIEFTWQTQNHDSQKTAGLQVNKGEEKEGECGGGEV